MKRTYLFLSLLLHLSSFAACTSYPSPMSTPPQQEIPTVKSDLDQGLELIEERDYAGGKTKLEDALKSQPGNGKVWFKLGRLYLGYYWDPKRAIEYAERALEYEPNNADFHEFLGEACARLAQQSGMNLNALRLATKAKAAFTRAVELEPDNLMARRALMEYLAQAPKIAGGNWNEAKTIAEETLSLNPAYAYVTLASLYRKKDEKEKAEECYLKAIEADPDNPWWHIELGWFYFDQKRHEDARAHFQKYQELRPKDPNSYLNLGRFYVLIREFAEAEAQLMKAIGIQPRYVEAWYRLGELYQRQGQEEKAQQAFQKCTALDGDNKWTGAAKDQKEAKEKRDRGKKRKEAVLQQYAVVGVLQSQQKKHNDGEIRTSYVVKDVNGILFSLPIKGKEAEEYIGRKVQVVGKGREKTDKKGVKSIILKEISKFEEVE